MTDAERHVQIAREDTIRQVIWRIAGLHTLTDTQTTLLARLILQREAALQVEVNKYHDLLYQVANKYVGETRHQTALRYLAEHQEHCLVSKEQQKGRTS